jgi:hypothetical protein
MLLQPTLLTGRRSAAWSGLRPGIARQHVGTTVALSPQARSEIPIGATLRRLALAIGVRRCLPHFGRERSLPALSCASMDTSGQRCRSRTSLHRGGRRFEPVTAHARSRWKDPERGSSHSPDSSGWLAILTNGDSHLDDAGRACARPSRRACVRRVLQLSTQ